MTVCIYVFADKTNKGTSSSDDEINNMYNKQKDGQAETKQVKKRFSGLDGCLGMG